MTRPKIRREFVAVIKTHAYGAALYVRNDSRLPDPELAHMNTYAHNALVLGQVRYVRLLVSVLENKTGGRDETCLADPLGQYVWSQVRA